MSQGVNEVRQRLRASEPTFGTFLMEFATPGVAHLASASGADFVFWDLQHTGWSVDRLSAGLASARTLPIAPGVRVPGPDPQVIGQALDLGARLIMVPAVADAQTARDIVAATRYPVPPWSGSRAVTFAFAWDGYDPPTDAEAALRAVNDDVVVFVQIETAEGLRNVDEIAAVEGVDVLWVGDNDLAASLGVPGQFDAPVYQAAIDEVAAAAARAGKVAGFTTADLSAGRELLDRGYSALAFGNDIKVFRDALRTGVEGLRAAART